MRQLQQQDAFSALSHFGAASLAQPYHRLTLQSHAGGALEGGEGEQEDQALGLMLPLGQVADGAGDVALEEVITRLMVSRDTPAGLLLTFGTNAGAGVAGAALSVDGISSGLALQPHGQCASSRRESTTGAAPPSYRGARACTSLTATGPGIPVDLGGPGRAHTLPLCMPCAGRLGGAGSSRGNLVSLATPPAGSAPSAANAAPGAPAPSSHPLGATHGGGALASFSIHTAKQGAPMPASASETESLVGTCVTPSSPPFTADQQHPSSSPAGLSGAPGQPPPQAEGPASSLHPSGALLMLPLPPTGAPGTLLGAASPGQAAAGKQAGRRASAQHDAGAAPAALTTPPLVETASQQAAQAPPAAAAHAPSVPGGTPLQMAELLHQAAGGGSVVGLGAGGRSAHSMMAGHVNGAEPFGSGALPLGERGAVSMRHSRSGIGVGRLQVGSMRRGSGRTPTAAPSPGLPLYDEVHAMLERAYTSW